MEKSRSCCELELRELDVSVSGGEMRGGDVTVASPWCDYFFFFAAAFFTGFFAAAFFVAMSTSPPFGVKSCDSM
jgi:hypothetical protein